MLVFYFFHICTLAFFNKSNFSQKKNSLGIIHMLSFFFTEVIFSFSKTSHSPKIMIEMTILLKAVILDDLCK